MNEWKKVDCQKTGYCLGNKKDNFWEMGDTGHAVLVRRFMLIAAVMKKEKHWMEKHW